MSLILGQTIIPCSCLPPSVCAQEKMTGRPRQNGATEDWKGACRQCRAGLAILKFLLYTTVGPWKIIFILT